MLWLVGGDDRLGPVATADVQQSGRLAVSVASLWEVAIKVSIGKLAAMPSFPAALWASGLERLDISDAHLARLGALPLLHRDPFDRLLVCQALVDNLRLVTSDVLLAGYGVSVVDARV